MKQTAELGHYDGLIFRTSVMYEDVLGFEREDLQQELRLTVWRALEAYTAERRVAPVMGNRDARESFVFTCVRNRVKDLIKSKTRSDRCHLCGGDGEVEEVRCSVCDGTGRIKGRVCSIEHFAPDHFTSPEGTDDVHLPNTLTEKEREIIALLYMGYSQREIASLIEADTKAIERGVREIKLKLRGWHPASEEGADAEVVQLEVQVRRAIQRVAA